MISEETPTHAIVNTVTDETLDEDDELLKQLEEEEDQEERLLFSSFRERRMDELKREFEKKKEMEAIRSGSYDIIQTEKEILHMTTSLPRVVVHFAHKDFRRCQIMDRHLRSLATKHFKTRFVKIDVENAPFLVEKLKIQVLPCLISFVDGVSTDRLLGFDGISEKDDFETSALETRLATSKVIVVQETVRQNQRKTIFGFAHNNEDSDDE